MKWLIFHLSKLAKIKHFLLNYLSVYITRKHWHYGLCQFINCFKELGRAGLPVEEDI